MENINCQRFVYLIILFVNSQIYIVSSNSSTIQLTSIESRLLTSTDLISNETNVSIDNSIMDIPTINREICDTNGENGINVIDRTSNMFIGIIDYNCSSINSSELFVFVNESPVNNCYITGNNTINVSCSDIENNAGRDWIFTIVQMSFDTDIEIVNKTFIVTLKPLLLNVSTDIRIDIDKNLTSALISVENCLLISDFEYLRIRCNDNDLLNNSLTENCTSICSSIQPGSIYNFSLIRLPIPIADQHGQTFQLDFIQKNYLINVDKVTNFLFNKSLVDDQIGLISFARPRGSYDRILINCFPQDEHCLNESIILTNNTSNCSSCTFLSIYPITNGITYQCQTTTIKQSFPLITSELFLFNTSLKPISFEKTIDNWYSYSNMFEYNVIPKSDYDQIDSSCLIDQNPTYPCSNLTNFHKDCSTLFKYNGIYGCNYTCFFITKKLNYSNEYSINYTMLILPPKPIVYLIEKGSRWISIEWKLDQLVYYKSFDLILNDTNIQSINKDKFNYNYTKLLPNQLYQINVRIVSNSNNKSDPIFVKTSEEVPSIPSDIDIKNKIVPLTKDIESRFDQYAIQFDLSLFSNQYSFINSYQIYVRQDEHKNDSKLDSIGTYNDAMKNESIDYLAVSIIFNRSSLTNLFNNSIRLILGNQTDCQQLSNQSIPCNGKLKSDKIYKIVINACTNPGCISVLSQPFRTLKNPTKDSSSKGWISIFPLLILLILISLGLLKRKQIKNSSQQFIQKFQKSKQSSIQYKSDGTIFLYPIIEQIKPKLLIEYLNLTAEQEKTIYNEYKKLESLCPESVRCKGELDTRRYDRYPNIFARGPWNRTAVRLIGKDRYYDYINANEINSYDNKKSYIGCQGPLKETVKDFWDMIIQYKVQTIIMLTKTEEINPQNHSKSLSKCFRYFPSDLGQCLTFDSIVIKVNDIEYYYNSNLEIRHLTIEKTDECIELNLIHYYFTGWPDYNVIESEKLIDLIETINKHRQHSFYLSNGKREYPPGRTVVHCSAGVGRTGTYICVETIIRLLDCSNEDLFKMKIDLMGIVFHLRKERGKMVQTQEQYLLVNRCIEQYLKRTNRLDLLLKETYIYQNLNVNSSRSSKNKISVYSEQINTKVTYRSNNEKNFSQRRSLPVDTSSLQISTMDNHTDRSSTIISSSQENSRDDNHCVPPLPLRTFRNTPVSIQSQQSNS